MTGLFGKQAAALKSGDIETFTVDEDQVVISMKSAVGGLFRRKND